MEKKIGYHLIGDFAENAEISARTTGLGSEKNAKAY